MAINIINGTSIPSIRGASRNERIASSAGKVRNEQTGPVAGADELRLTPESLRLRELETSLSTEPTFNKERVESLRKAIDSGEYKIDAIKVAKQLLDLEGKLFK